MRLDVKLNTIKGTVSGLFNKVVVTLLPFLMRTIMIYKMGTQYLGLSSLFSSILSMLSLAELGFGNALVYSMYKPIAENNVDEVCALLALYKKIYRIIGLFILGIGVLISPFLQHFIHGSIPEDINLYLLYFIYLINTAASYFLFAYKNSLLAAFQRNDISNNISTVLTLIEYLVQIAVILRFENYYLYAIAFPVFTVIGNLVRTAIVQKKFPQYLCRGEVGKSQKRDIYTKALALASHKIGNTISTALDSMVISTFLGLTAVAIFDNYRYIITTVMALILIIYNSMAAGIGNRMNVNTIEKCHKDFMALTAFNNALSCWCVGCLLFLYQPFMKLWVGTGNTLSYQSVIVFVVYFYVFQCRRVVTLFKDAAGLWKEDQLKPFIGAALNLALNIALVKRIGINGVIISSIVSFIVIEIPWETHALYKYYFKTSARNYILEMIQAVFQAVPCWIILGILCSCIPVKNLYLELVFKGLICALVPIPYIILLYRKKLGFARILGSTLKTNPHAFR